ncbi:hypothetical protein VSS37_03510 [Candidatus Thiothrix sp. Deng01]|uniref:Uncharacterized protein n=1 Tax=Candidatus Thiothrix phosphatis TaxID=3112415 RepID=A0ABU6CTA6_9GAMM|nr:hypothetical protein [Candidatus Thiothrix sp. Deng01]MEB4590038.1 hypothetical protein [Candidatus Thiothrix sp. Deng01]
MDYLKDLLEEMQENPFKWTSAYSALRDYIEHNDKTALIDAIRNKPEIMEYQTVRNFIADVMEGKKIKKIRKGGFVHKSNAERNEKILQLIVVYKAMGYPVKPSPYPDKEMTCCNLAGRKFFVSADTVDKEIYRKCDKTERDYIDDPIRLLNVAQGRTLVRLNGGVKPDNISDLDKLEQQFDEIKHDKDNTRRQIFYEEQTKLMNEMLKGE